MALSGHMRELRLEGNCPECGRHVLIYHMIDERQTNVAVECPQCGRMFGLVVQLAFALRRPAVGPTEFKS